MSTALFSARVAPKRDANGWTTPPANLSHAIYLILEEFPESKQSDIRALLKERNHDYHNLQVSISTLHNGGFIKYRSIKGGLNENDVDQRNKLRWSVTDALYVPKKPMMRKIKPVAKEAVQQPVIQTKPEAVDAPKESKQQHLALVQGIATLDASDPAFAETAKKIIDKVGKQDAPEPGAKPLITGIFIDLGEKQNVVLTPAMFSQLLSEMKMMAGESQTPAPTITMEQFTQMYLAMKKSGVK